MAVLRMRVWIRLSRLRYPCLDERLSPQNEGFSTSMPSQAALLPRDESSEPLSEKLLRRIRTGLSIGRTSCTQVDRGLSIKQFRTVRRVVGAAQGALQGHETVFRTPPILEWAGQALRFRIGGAGRPLTGPIGRRSGRGMSSRQALGLGNVSILSA
jgi:hypothetical protein